MTSLQCTFASLIRFMALEFLSLLILSAVDALLLLVITFLIATAISFFQIQTSIHALSICFHAFPLLTQNTNFDISKFTLMLANTTISFFTDLQTFFKIKYFVATTSPAIFIENLAFSVLIEYQSIFEAAANLVETLINIIEGVAVHEMMRQMELEAY